MQSRASFAIVGDNTIDRYLGLDGVEYVGGNALNVAAQLALAGEPVHYFGAVGPDKDGRTITETLQRTSASIDGVMVLPGETALTEIRLTDGDRFFEREDFGVTADYFPSPAHLDLMAAADWVHLGMLPRATELRSALKARNPLVTISQDCAVAKGYSDLDIAFESVGESDQAAADAAARAVSAGVALAVVTKGAAGAIAHDGREWWREPAVPIDVVDTTGAGDSFIAGFIQSRSRGAGISEALTDGAKWAAQTCQHVAGFPQVGHKG
jgi:fructoselysine 6-kinase